MNTTLSEHKNQIEEFLVVQVINYLEYGDFMSAKKLTNASKIVFRENTNFIKLAALSSLGLNQVEEAEHELERLESVYPEIVRDWPEHLLLKARIKGLQGDYLSSKNFTKMYLDRKL